MKYVKDWQASTRRYDAYWAGEITDRCCVAVTAPKKAIAPLPQYAPEEVMRRWTDGEWLYDNWTKQFENTYFAGDAFPNFWLNLGPSGHAGYCKGAKYKLMQQNSGLSCTAWYDHHIADWEKQFPTFDKESFLYKKTLALAEYMAGRSGGDFMISMPDTSGNLDALAHLRGSEDLLVDMMDDEDEAVLRAIDVMEHIFEETITAVYARVKANNGDASSIGWMQLWAPGLMAQMQCDLSVMISNAVYENLPMKELRRQCDFLEYPLYHFDGQEQIRHLDSLLSLEKLKAIQWTPVDGQPSPVEHIPTLKRIQNAGKRLFLMIKPWEVEPIMTALSSKGLHMSVDAQTPDEADAVVQLVKRLTHE